MNTREERIEAEAGALWRELYHEQPPATAGGGDILDLMLQRLPEARYDRMMSPFLRPTQIARPR